MRAPGRTGGAFAAAVLRAVRAIPRGRIATYGDVAFLAGRPGAARAVAGILRAADEADVPYHRVVGADGRVGGAGRLGVRDDGVADRARRLRREGIAVAPGGQIAAFAQRRWNG